MRAGARGIANVWARALEASAAAYVCIHLHVLQAVAGLHMQAGLVHASVYSLC